VTHRIVIAPEARDDLESLYDYIAGAASPAIALRFTDGILDRLALLADRPGIGAPRDDLRPGLRTLAYRGRATIAFMVDDVEVVVLGVFYGGRDFESLLREGGS
jgi:toxin ParE1/3/4